MLCINKRQHKVTCVSKGNHVDTYIHCNYMYIEATTCDIFIEQNKPHSHSFSLRKRKLLKYILRLGGSEKSRNVLFRFKIYLELVYLVTALVPSLTACLASSPGNKRRTAVWISRLVMVDLLL